MVWTVHVRTYVELTRLTTFTQQNFRKWPNGWMTRKNQIKGIRLYGTSNFDRIFIVFLSKNESPLFSITETYIMRNFGRFLDAWTRKGRLVCLVNSFTMFLNPLLCEVFWILLVLCWVGDGSAVYEKRWVFDGTFSTGETYIVSHTQLSYEL